MFDHEKIFTVYEKPEAAEPTDRVLLLRDGFSFWALTLTVVWLTANRMWWGLMLYVAAAITLSAVCDLLHVSELSSLFAQLWLQAMLAYHAYDVQGWALRRRGYKMAGILCAESEMHAQRRYETFAT